MTQEIKKNKAFVLLFAVTLSSILLAIALGVSNIALKEVKFSTNARDTNNAFFAADTGVECALFNDKSTGSAFVNNGTVRCLDQDIPMGAPPLWTFVISNLGSESKSCANVTVNKTDPAKTVITSKGYNIQSSDDMCTPTVDRVEREIKVTY